MNVAQAKYEASLARASRALRDASSAADEMNAEGERCDCTQLRFGVRLLLEDSVAKRHRRPMSGQLGLISD